MIKSIEQIEQNFDYSKYEAEFKNLKKRKRISNLWAILAFILFFSTLFLTIKALSLIYVWIIVIFLILTAIFILKKYIKPEEDAEKKFRNKILLDFLKYIDKNSNFVDYNPKVKKFFENSCIIETKVKDNINVSDFIESSIDEKYLLSAKY